jgi:hypothetical protein
MRSLLLSVLSVATLSARGNAGEWIELNEAVVVSPFAGAESPEGEAVRLLIEEAAKRTGKSWPASESWPMGDGPVIVLTSAQNLEEWPRSYPGRSGPSLPERRPEGYRLVVDKARGRSPVVWAVGADSRGVLFAAGGLLHSLRLNKGRAAVSADLDVATTPAYSLRGHQLGYRAKANTYDAWTPGDYEQHIRDLIVFGANAIEQIPLEEPYSSPHFPISRADMNVELSKICARYGIQYWMWMPVMEHRNETPGTLALRTEEERQDMLGVWSELFERCPRIDGIFVPSSDPGMNKAELMMPFLEQVARTLLNYHPNAKVWMSHQGLGDEDQDFLYAWLEEHQPDWFGGVVFGPWSQTTFAETRTRLPEKYGVRSYPDITHTVRCQFPVIHWDRAFALTLGRECINPRPVTEKIIHNIFAPETIGFITYSDGIHDDVNKIVWTAMGWDPAKDVRDVLIEYGRYFVRDDLGEGIADGLLALEQNWVGPLATNGSVEGTLRLWHALEECGFEEAENNWRFQHGLFRAYYDAYTRRRLIYEQELERRVNELLAKAGEPDPNTKFSWDAEHVMFRADRILRLADLEPVMPEWRERIIHLADRMMAVIGHQTSVERHAQLDYDRGTMLDTLNHPLNDRWWFEDEFAQIRMLKTEGERAAALRSLARYESPVPGAFYDDLGDITKSPRLAHIEGLTMDPVLRQTLDEKAQSWQPYTDRRRLSQQDGVGDFRHWSPAWGIETRYVSLARKAEYRLRMASNKVASSRYAIYADDVSLKPMGPPATLDLIEEYEVPRELTADGALQIRWDVEEGIGIQITEIWLIPSAATAASEGM